MIVVIGLGRETRELLRILDRTDPTASVLLLDERTPAADELLPLTHLRLQVHGGADLDVVGTVPLDATMIYRSPGVSPYRPALAAAVAAGIPVTTPTGYWASGRDNDDVLAITGTKGKSTTAALTAHLLAAAGRRVSLRGNIGRAALLADEDDHLADGAAASGPVQDIVLELSSYQLADLRAPIGLGAITTLLRDHVPWHGTLERYHADKLRLLSLAQRTIITRDVAARLPTGADRIGVPAAAHHVTGLATAPLHDAVRDALAEAGLIGEHLVQDAELALALVDARLEIPGGSAELVAALADFRPLPHRLTPVGEHDGRRYVDDSISTVPESAVAAVRAYRPLGAVTVLLGGDDRGQDLAPLVALLADPEIRAVLLPPLADRLHAALHPVAGDRVTVAQDLADAVDRATAVTPAGGSVVLSPAAPSFASYRDFVARGEHFTALVAAYVAQG